MSARLAQTAARSARSHASASRSVRPRYLSTHVRLGILVGESYSDAAFEFSQHRVHQPPRHQPALRTSLLASQAVPSFLAACKVALTPILYHDHSHSTNSYGYYHYSGTAAVVSTARQTIDAATHAKDKALASTPSPKDALHLLRTLASPYVAVVPGGAAMLDASVGQLEGLLEKHGDEVSEILKKTLNDVKTAVGDPKEGGEKIMKAVEETMSKIGELAQGQLNKVLEKNPEWKEAVGGGLEQLQELSKSQ